MFTSAKEKIHRADTHIADFERQSNAFILSKPNRFETHPDPQTGQMTVRVKFLKKTPAEIPLIIADAIHNLRTALDHVAWELAAVGNGAQDRYTKFITGRDRQSFEGSCNGIKTSSQWVRDAFRAQEAFPEGRGHELYNLTELDNADKHTLTAPVLRVTGHPPMRVIRPDGRVAVTMEGNALTVVGQGDGIPLFIAPGDFTVEFGEDTDFPASIFFGKPDEVFEPAWSMLRGFRIAVYAAIADIESRIP